MSRPAGLKTDIQPLEFWEFQLVLAYLASHWKPVFQVLWETGIRLGECLALTKRDLENGGISVAREKRIDHPRHWLPLTPELYAQLEYIRDHTKPVRLFPYSEGAAWYALKKAAIKAGIRKTIHPHSFRHAMGYRIKDMTNGDLTMVKEILGHKDIRSAQRYVNPPYHKVIQTIRDLNK